MAVQPFKEALAEYIDHYLRPRMDYKMVSLALGKNRAWLSNWLKNDSGVPAKTLLKIYQLLPEILDGIEAGTIAEPVVREVGGQPR